MPRRYTDPWKIKKFRKGDRVIISNEKMKTHGLTGVISRCWTIESKAYCAIRRDDDPSKVIACVKQENVEYYEP